MNTSYTVFVLAGLKPTVRATSACTMASVTRVDDGGVGSNTSACVPSRLVAETPYCVSIPVCATMPLELERNDCMFDEYELGIEPQKMQTTLGPFMTPPPWLIRFPLPPGVALLDGLSFPLLSPPLPLFPLAGFVSWCPAFGFRSLAF